MNTQHFSKSKRRRGYAILLVLFFSGISLMMLSGALQWTSSSARLNDRNNQYFSAVSAAEAATEKTLTKISRDYLRGGEADVYNNLGVYRSYIPSSDEDAYWARYSFSDAQGNDASTYVSRTASQAFVPIDSQYQGLYGLAASYRIVSNARVANLRPPLVAAVRQDIQVAAIPLFQFAIFYTMDLEINPGPAMAVTGRVHSNGNIYLQPQSSLAFLDDITSAGTIFLTKSSLDPTIRTPGPIRFDKEHDSGVRSLNLPIGTNNSPAAVRQIVEMPPAGESINSPMGSQRYYNKSDLVVDVTNTNVVVKAGAWTNFSTAIPYNQVSSWLNTNVSFYNKREGKTVQATQIDVAKLISWSATNTAIRPYQLRDVDSIYVADERTQTASTEPGLRLVNGAVLPSRGLTVASPDPVYVLGDYNAPSAVRGTTNTLSTKPASIVGDAVTILSPAWSDANSSAGIASRVAANTTVNAAIIAGIVPSNGTSYSGGVENLPRFLENWAGKMFTYNGSMVMMYPSKFARAAWGGNDVYSPPNRNWAFDRNFLDATKLPPGTPMALTTIRNEWAMIPPNSIE
jgi:hypothetical protein